MDDFLPFLIVSFPGLLVWGWYVQRRVEGRDPLPLVGARPFPCSLADLALVLAGVLTVYLIAGFVLSLAVLGDWTAMFKPAAESTEVGLSVGLITKLAIDLVTTGIVFAAVIVWRQGKVSDLGLRRDGNRRAAVAGVAGYAAVFPAVIIAAKTSEWVLQTEPPKHPVEQILRQFDQDPTLAMLAVFTAVVAAPVFEEILFRSFIQSALRETLGPGLAVTASALLFALVHDDSFKFASLFVLALMLGFLYERTRNLIAPVLAHACLNAGSVLIVFATRPLPDVPLQ